MDATIRNGQDMMEQKLLIQNTKKPIINVVGIQEYALGRVQFQFTELYMTTAIKRKGLSDIMSAWQRRVFIKKKEVE